ncbi:MAG TPA: hypothetical protein VFG46_26745 [Chryseolinea sp.]|nr:hypothetical protein [Chryseolinea sp.]
MTFIVLNEFTPYAPKNEKVEVDFLWRDPHPTFGAGPVRQRTGGRRYQDVAPTGLARFKTSSRVRILDSVPIIILHSLPAGLALRADAEAMAQAATRKRGRQRCSVFEIYCPQCRTCYQSSTQRQ